MANWEVRDSKVLHQCSGGRLRSPLLKRRLYAEGKYLGVEFECKTCGSKFRVTKNGQPGQTPQSV